MFKRLIKAIEFSISSDQDVLSQSVVEVLHGKIPRGQEETCNTLYDLRMGTIEKGVKCETFSMYYTKCKGHFGHNAPAVPVVNPICLKKLKWIVKHICKKCRIVLTKQAALCFHCSTPQTFDNMFDVDNIEHLEEVSKILTNMCQEGIDVLNIKGCHPKSCIRQEIYISFRANVSSLKCLGLFGSTMISLYSSQKLYVTMAFGVSPSANSVQPLLHVNSTLALCLI